MRGREFRERFLTVHKCGGCRRILEWTHCHDALCPACRLRWNVAKVESCPICFQSAVDCICQPKGLSSVGALCLRKLIFYVAGRRKEPQNRLIYFLKQNRNRRMARFLAGELSGMIRKELDVLGVEEPAEEVLLVGVPRSKKSRMMYGFDQSELICGELASVTGIPTASVIGRHFGGKEQKNLGRDKRFRNIRRLFFLKDEEAVRGKVVILFDDIVTSGASMAACVSLLKKAGAQAVICLCIAQTL